MSVGPPGRMLQCCRSETIGMKIKIVVALSCFALFCAAFPYLSVQGQAQSLRRLVVTPPSIHEYALTYLSLPDTSRQGQRHWRWVLRRMDSSPSPRGEVQIPHEEVLQFKSLDTPLLKAYIRRLPSGSTLGLAWPGKKSAFARQAGLTDLQRLCRSRRIGFDVLYVGSS